MSTVLALPIVAVAIWYFVSPLSGLLVFAMALYVRARTGVMRFQAEKAIADLRKRHMTAMTTTEWHYLWYYAVFFIYPHFAREFAAHGAVLLASSLVVGVLFALDGRWYETAGAVLLVLLSAPLVNLNHPHLAARRARLAEASGRFTAEFYEAHVFNKVAKALPQLLEQPAGTE